MKREIEMYVDVFKEKSGKISCNVMYQGELYLIRDLSLEEYADEVILLKDKTMCTSDDEIKIYVDARGFGLATYYILKNKYNNVHKLIYGKYDNKHIRFKDGTKDAMYVTENKIDFHDWNLANVGTIKCDDVVVKDKDKNKNSNVFVDPTHTIKIKNEGITISDCEKFIEQLKQVSKDNQI